MNDLHSSASAVFRAYGAFCSERRKVRLGGIPLLKCDIISSPLRTLLFFSRFYSFCRSLSSASGRLRLASFICLASFLLLPFSGIYIPQQRAITFCLSGEKVTVVCLTNVKRAISGCVIFSIHLPYHVRKTRDRSFLARVTYIVPLLWPSARNPLFNLLQSCVRDIIDRLRQPREPPVDG